MSTKEKLFEWVDEMKCELIGLGSYIHANPELGNQEYKAVERITSVLEHYGFSIETRLAGLETAFRAKFERGQGGPKLGILCEYDALIDLGHGCGHNLQSPSAIGAAVALSKLDTLSAFSIEVIGTPAEETTSGKIPMAEQGCFDHLDIALMMHGGDRTTVDGRSLAIDSFDFIFHGKESHAAVAPEKGISALDGVLMTFNGIEYLREHVTSDVRIHGVITDGGTAANIVPERASASFAVRAQNRPYLNEVTERVLNVVKGAALITGTQVKVVKKKSLESKLNVQVLNDVMLENAKLAGAKNITPPRERTGSTDFSIVTHRVPGACIRVAFVPQGVPNHTKDWVEASNSADGHEAILTAAKILGGTCLDVLNSPDLLLEIKKEFSIEKQSQQSLILN